jgi:hypothetical protein
MQAIAPAARFIARFAVLLLVFYVLEGAVRIIGLCFGAGFPFDPLLRPYCVVITYAIRTSILAEGDAPGLLLHYLPSFVLAFVVTVAWTLMDRRRIVLHRMHPAMRFAVLLLVLSFLYELAGGANACFSINWWVPLEAVPACVRRYYEGVARDLSGPGFRDLLSHLLPPFAAAVLIAVARARTDRRRGRP